MNPDLVWPPYVLCRDRHLADFATWDLGTRPKYSVPGGQFVRPDEVEQVIKANIDKTVWVVYVDGETDELFVHTLDDEGFVCDIANEMSQPPPLRVLGPIYGCP